MKKIICSILMVLLIVGCATPSAPKEKVQTKIYARDQTIMYNGLEVKIANIKPDYSYYGSQNSFVVSMDVGVIGDDFQSKVRRKVIGNIAFDYIIEVFDPQTGKKYSPREDDPMSFSGEPLGDKLHLVALFDNEVSEIDYDVYLVLYKLKEHYGRFDTFSEINTDNYVFKVKPLI